MYFLTNKDGFIVAASQKLITALDSKDLCSISNAFKSKLINLNRDSNKIEISNKEIVFNYSQTTIYSLFGELTIYNLSEFKEPLNSEDENIAYLKKIKEESTNKSNNGYAISDTSTIENSDKTSIENGLKKCKDLKVTIEKTESATEKKIEADKLLDEITKVDKPYIEDKKNEEKIDKKSKSLIEDGKDATPTVAKDIVAIENIKTADIPEAVKTFEKDIKIVDKKIETSAKELEIKLKDSSKEILKELKDIEPKESINKETDNIDKPELSDESTKKDTKENRDKEETKIDDDTAKREIKEKNKKSESVISKITKILSPWSRKNNTIELEDGDFEIDLKVDKKIESKTDNNTPKELNNPSKEIVVKKADEDSSSEQRETFNNEINKPKEKKDIAKISKEVHKEAKAETINEESSKNKKVTKEPTCKNLASEVDDINLQKNAKKLSIDYNSYITLIENYLNEIERYSGKLLLDDISSTINILTDAGELLSLNILTKKFEKLENSNTKRDVLNEINLICTLIKEKIKSTNKEIKNEGSTIKTGENISTYNRASPPKETTKIITTNNPLDEIQNRKNIFNPDKISIELNLPRDIVIEFVKDFLTQSKEQLSTVKKAYNNNDIKTIQTTAKMLQAVATNLKLDTISESLFKLEKENNIENSIIIIKQLTTQIDDLDQAVIRWSVNSGL